MATPLMHDPAITTPEEIIERGIFPTTMKYFAVMVDDEMAADLLMYNVEPKIGKTATNRKASPVKIREYAFKMITDEWHLNPQPLVFTEVNGEGVIEQGDGQQRLKAVREANKVRPGIQVPFIICIDAPLLAKMVVDQGKGRQLSDWLRMGGEANSAQLSYAVKMLYCFKELRPFTSIAAWRGTKLTPIQQAAYLAKHPTLRQGLTEAMSAKTAVMPYVGTVLWYLMREEYGPFVASQFMTGMYTGAELKIHDVRLILRNYLARKQNEEYPWDGFEQLGLLITAANAWLTKAENYRAGSAYKKTDKKFPQLLNREVLPQELFQQDTQISLELDEMEAVGAKR